MKTCTKCGKSRDESEYRTDANTPDTLAYECKRCHAANERRRRGGLRRMMIDLPDDLRAPIERILEEEDKTPAELLEELLRTRLDNSPPLG